MNGFQWTTPLVGFLDTPARRLLLVDGQPGSTPFVTRLLPGSRAALAVPDSGPPLTPYDVERLDSRGATVCPK